MTTIREAAQNYESKQTKNIIELQVVRTDLDVLDGKGTDNEGKEFEYKYTLVNGEEYRIPNSVLRDLKTILTQNPNLKTFQVRRSGSGFNTKYTVITLE